MSEYTTLSLSEPTANIMQINLSRADALNALNNLLLTELSDVLDKISANQNILGILITGTGKAFCAGADLKELANLDNAAGTKFAAQGQAVFNKLENLGKPSIAAVNGFAFGGGCELAMSASIRAASESAKFAQPESKLGLIPGYGGTQRLARLVGKGRAIDLCISGRTLSANQAEQWGLVNYVTTPEKLLDQSLEILTTICKMGPLAVKSILAVIHQGFDLSMPAALQLEAEHFGKMCTTQDKQEGLTAFLEKRQATFIGK